MDADRFDALSRSHRTAGSRRHALTGLLLGTLGLLEGVDARDAAAKDCKKIDNKQKRKKCLAKAKDTVILTPTPTPPPPPPPAPSVPVCPPERVCANGCCPTNQYCRADGLCVCQEVGAHCGPSADGLPCCSGVCGRNNASGINSCRRVTCSVVGGRCVDSFDCCIGFCDAGFCGTF